MAKISGTQTEVGIGLEATAGTAVAASVFPKWSELSLQSVVEKTMLKSARGVRNETSDSRIRRKYAKGSLGLVPNVKNAAPLFYMALGSLSTSGPSDSAYTHSITPQDANASMKAATLITEDGGTVTERYSNVVANALNLEVAD